MSKLKAILFDYDGTLRDTRELIYDAFEHAFVTHGLKAPTKQQLAPYIHHHTEIHRELAPSIPFADFEAVYKQRIEELRPTTQLYEYSSAVLEALHKSGYKLALVTAAYSVHSDVVRLRVSKYWNVIIGGNDVTKHKPDPEGIYKALQELRITADEAMYVGDLPTDVQAAHAAGIDTVVGITHGFSDKKALKQAGASHIIDSLPELLEVVADLEVQDA